MIVDLEREQPPLEFCPDVCVVGAGAAGLVLAAELVRQGKRVLLLESGGADCESAAQDLNACVYTGQPQRAASLGRFRVLGGTTTAWGGQVLEFTPQDFSARPWVPGSGWPFEKEALMGYYQRAVRAESLDAAIQSDAQVWHELKMRVPQLGDDFDPYFTRWCPEPNFARLYRELLSSPNLCVVLHATATAMLFEESGGRVRGVRVRTPAGRERSFSAAQYVLCLGTIESVRFLLQPMLGGQTPSWNRSGLLGHHFQSHIDFNAARISARDATSLWRTFANVYLHGQKYHPKFRLNALAQARKETLSIAASITCVYSQEEELQRLKFLARNLLRGRLPKVAFADAARLLRQAETMAVLGYAYAVKHRAAWPRPSAFWLRVHCEQEPLSASRITLLDERDAAGTLRAKLDWRVSRMEWHSIRQFTEQAQRAFIAFGWGEILLQSELAREDGYSTVTFDNSHHDMGGARMAVSSADGVVDPDLKLHGVDNAYLCSTAVFPTSGFSNPTHTLLALAIRLADHLKGNSHA